MSIQTNNIFRLIIFLKIKTYALYKEQEKVFLHEPLLQNAMLLNDQQIDFLKIKRMIFGVLPHIFRNILLIYI